MIGIWYTYMRYRYDLHCKYIQINRSIIQVYHIRIVKCTVGWQGFRNTSQELYYLIYGCISFDSLSSIVAEFSGFYVNSHGKRV